MSVGGKADASPEAPDEQGSTVGRLIGNVERIERTLAICGDEVNPPRSTRGSLCA
jgi:hypothetical protein